MMRRLRLVATGCLVGVLLLLALPVGALAGTSTTIVVSRFTIPCSLTSPGVDTDGRYVLCNGNCELVCRDLQTGKDITIPGATGVLWGTMRSPMASASGCPGTGQGIINGFDGYDISTGQSFTIDSGQQGWGFVIGDGIVAWVNGDHGGYCAVDGYDIATGTMFNACPADAVRFVGGVAKGLIVYDQQTGGEGDVWGYLVKTQESFPVCTNPANQWDPTTDGRTVAWLDMRDGNYYDVWAYDLASKRTFCMSAAARVNNSRLDADNGVFVWGDNRDNATSVRGYYAPSHTAFVISPNSGATLVSSPVVAKNLVVWDEQMGAVQTLYGARLHEWVCVVSAPTHARSRTVRVTVTSRASAAEVTRMRFSLNGRWSAWMAFRHTHLLALTGAAGTKKIGVELRDASGHISRAATATVRLL